MSKSKKIEELLSILEGSVVVRGPHNFDKFVGEILKWHEKHSREAYKKGVEDEIECVETSGEHLDLQAKLKKGSRGLG